MAIVQNIIEEHGASITAKNVAPNGALVVIEFNCV
jgi:nitrogen fixation/metabolism regulation signal transduction histidine kinase